MTGWLDAILQKTVSRKVEHGVLLAGSWSSLPPSLVEVWVFTAVGTRT